GDRPRAHPKARPLCLPAKIQVIEVEGEALIEPERLVSQSLAADRQKNAVEQLHALGRRAPYTDDICGKTGAVANDSAEILSALLIGRLIDEPPAGLPW